VGELETEVCVVGGGLAGLNTALGLAEKGIKTVLIEAARVGFGASGRNGGFVGCGYSQDMGVLEQRLGLDHARGLHDLTRDALATIRSRIERHAIDCGPNVSGTLVASWTDNPDGLRRHAEDAHEKYGVTLDFVARERLVEDYASSPRYFDGLYKAESFQFHPLNYCLGIARAAEAAGLKIFEHTPLVSLEIEQAEKQIETPRGLIRARHIVLACGGYGPGVLPEVSSAVLPVATYVMATAPMNDNVLGTAIRKPICIADTRGAGDYYRALPDGRVIWGGRMTVRNSKPPRLAHDMLGDLLKVYPQLEGHAAVETSWMGTMSYARHRMPQIGRLREGVWYAQAFGGSGMGTTTVAGDLLATAIADGDDRYRLFEPFGLTWAGGPFGRLAAQAIYWSYQAQDWATARRDFNKRRISTTLEQGS
ncbi:MAG: FAD-binding oxidoreductase, partial [Rhodospirillaceae bacterium]|nr:FAD-binding oxidoreductase [Rhodospirillaceae bacterium]